SLPAIERNAGPEIGHAHRELIDHAAAEAEADGADTAVALVRRLQPFDRGDEVLDEACAVELPEQLARAILIAGIAAERRQRIGRERDEPTERDAAGNVLDVRIQPAVLVNDDDAGPRLRRAGGRDEIAAKGAGAARRFEVDVTRFDAPIVL